MPFTPFYADNCPLCSDKLSNDFEYSFCRKCGSYNHIIIKNIYHNSRIQIADFRLWYYNSPKLTCVYKLLHSDVLGDKWDYLFKIDEFFEVNFNEPQQTINRLQTLTLYL